MRSHYSCFLHCLARLVFFALLCAAGPSCSKRSAPPVPQPAPPITPPHPAAIRPQPLPEKAPAPIAFPALDTGEIGSLQFSPDGRRLAFGYGLDAEVTMWNLETGRLAWQRHVNGADGGPLLFDPQGRFLVAISGDGDTAFKTWVCTVGGLLIRQMPSWNWEYQPQVNLERSGRFLVVSGKRTRSPLYEYRNRTSLPVTAVWNTRTWRRVDSVPREMKPPVLLTASGHIRQRSHGTGLQPQTYTDNFTIVRGLCSVTIGGNHSDKGFVVARDVNNEKKLWAVTIKNDCPLIAAMSPDGRTLATGSINGVVEFRDLLTGRLIAETHCSDDLIRCLTYSPNGNVLAAAGGNGGYGPYGGGRNGIRLLNARSHTLLAVLKAAFPGYDDLKKDWTLDHPDWFAALPDLSYLASESVTKKIRMPGRERDAGFVQRWERPQKVRTALSRCFR